MVIITIAFHCFARAYHSYKKFNIVFAMKVLINDTYTNYNIYV